MERVFSGTGIKLIISPCVARPDEDFLACAGCRCVGANPRARVLPCDRPCSLAHCAKVPADGAFAFKTGVRAAPVILSDLVAEISSARSHLVALEATAASLGDTLNSTASALRDSIADVVLVRAAAVDPVISALRSEMESIRSKYVVQCLVYDQFTFTVATVNCSCSLSAHCCSPCGCLPCPPPTPAKNTKHNTAPMPPTAWWRPPAPRWHP